MSSLPYDIDEACSGSKELDLVKLIVDLCMGEEKLRTCHSFPEVYRSLAAVTC